MVPEVSSITPIDSIEKFAARTTRQPPSTAKMEAAEAAAAETMQAIDAAAAAAEAMVALERHPDEPLVVIRRRRPGVPKGVKNIQAGQRHPTGLDGPARRGQEYLMREADGRKNARYQNSAF